MIMCFNFVFFYSFIVYTNVYASNPHLYQTDTSTYDSDDEEVARILSSAEKKDSSHKPSQSMFYQAGPSKSQNVLGMATSSMSKHTHATVPPTLQSTHHENTPYTSQKPGYTTYACITKPYITRVPITCKPHDNTITEQTQGTQHHQKQCNPNVTKSNLEQFSEKKPLPSFSQQTTTNQSTRTILVARRQKKK